MKYLTPSQNEFIKMMTLSYSDQGFIKKYSNPLSQLLLAYKEDSYTLIYGEYIIPEDFQLGFSTDDSQLRFGLVYNGKTEFKVTNKPSSNFYPSQFMAIEDHLSGTQTWKKGHQYKGIELFIDMAYLKNELGLFSDDLTEIFKLPLNQAILYLPSGVISILKILENKLIAKSLTPLYLKAKILECLSIISENLKSLDTQALYELINMRSLKISDMKDAQLTSSDISAIHEAHFLITSHIKYPLTINELSKKLYINEQKLTVGFKKLYHTTIGNYLKELRLFEAANLLTTSDLSIDSIAEAVGYSHSSNLSKAFKLKYHRTPLQYRKFNSK